MNSSRTFKVPPDIAEDAEQYWNACGAAKLRLPNKGDVCYYIGWSDRQELYVLIDEDTDEGDNYPFAESAYCKLWDKVPLDFLVDGEAIGGIGLGFSDIEGTDVTELSLSDLWVATLLQYYFDKKKAGLCLRMTGSLETDQMLRAHAESAFYPPRPTGRYAVFKSMGNKHEVLTYVQNYYEMEGELPRGEKVLQSGLVVTFPGES